MPDAPFAEAFTDMAAADDRINATPNNPAPSPPARHAAAEAAERPVENPAIPDDAREEALRKVLRHDAPSLVGNDRAFHQMLRDGVPIDIVATTAASPAITSA